MNLHPPSVHFPIALLLVAGGMYVFSLWQKEDFAFRVAGLLHGLGLIGVLIAVILGKVESSQIQVSGEGQALLKQHEIMAYGVLWSYGMLWLWQYVRKKALLQVRINGEKITFCIIFLIACAFMTYSSYLGGKMVFEQGIGVNVFPAPDDKN